MIDKAQGAEPVTIEFALRQIIEADDKHELTQQLIEIGRAALKAQPAPTEAQGGFLVRVTPTDPEYADVHPQLALEDALRVSPHGWPDGFQFEIVAAQGEDSARLDFFAPVVLDPSCGCAKCNPRAVGRMMILCATCGNKRCPHATDHALACTNSNEPGQVGSAYGPAAPQPQEAES